MINLHITKQIVAFLYLYVCGFVPEGFFMSVHMHRLGPPDVWKYLLPLCLLWLWARPHAFLPAQLSNFQNILQGHLRDPIDHALMYF